MQTRLSKNDVLNYSSSLSLLNINSVCLSRSVMSNSFDSMDCSPHSSVCGDSPGKNTGVGCHFLLQGISLTQGSNLRLRCLLHCRRILYLLSHGEAAGQTLGWDIIPPQKRSLKRRLRILHLTCRHFHSGIESFSVSVT